MNTPALLLWIPRHLSLNLHFLFALELGMHGRLNHLFPFRIHPCGTPPLSPLSFALCLIPPILLLISSSPSSPTSPPSSVRPRRVRTRNTDGTGSASSALDADVEGGGSVQVSAFMPPNGIFSPVSSPGSSRASSRNASRRVHQSPSPSSYSRHPNGISSPHTSSPPSPSMSEA